MSGGGAVGWSDLTGDFAAMRLEKGLKPGGRYCSACWTGEWHGKLERIFYPPGSMTTDHEGNLKPRAASSGVERKRDENA